MIERIPLVSIGMPAYNAGRFVRQSVESILGQTLGDLELVISDNASTDATGDICREYAASDDRVRYVRQPWNLGVNGNYNAVFRLARGRYFKWASSNDICRPAFLERCVGVLQAHDDVVLCYPQTQLIGDDGEHLSEAEPVAVLAHPSPVVRFFGFLDGKHLNNAFNGVMRPQLLRWAGPLRDYLSSDIPYMASLLLWGKAHCVEEPLFLRRLGPTSHSTAHRQKADHYKHDEAHVMLKYFRDCVNGVLRGPNTSSEKARLLAGLLRRMAWKRDEIASELWDVALRPFARAPS